MLGFSFLFLLLAEIINIVFFQPLHIANTNTIIIESIFLICISLAMFNKIRESMQYQHLLKEGIFWFNSAVLIYYSISFLIWGFHSIRVYEMKNPPLVIYSLNLFFSALLYLFYSFSLFENFFTKRKTTGQA
jgi:hypothetical protein